MGYLLVSIVCFSGIVLIFYALKMMEDKTRKHNVYYTVTPIFAYLATPILVPIILGLAGLGVVFLLAAIVFK